MSVWDGLIRCSPLSSTCFVDWAAVTTGLAAVVALGVGVAPVIRDRCHRMRHAKMVAKISAGELALMEHRLLVAAKVIELSNDLVDHWQQQEVGKLIAQISADSVSPLIPHVHSITSELEKRLAKCVALLRAFERSLWKVEKTRPSEMVRMEGDRVYYVSCAKELNEFRKELCTWSKTDFEDLTNVVDVGVKDANLRASDESIRFRMHNPPSLDHTIEPS
nr:hypothetical protein [Stenotrophomonas pavanii]